MRPALLSDIEIQRELNSTLRGWTRRGPMLLKTYQFATFAEAIAWVNLVAIAAEAANHHPDLDIRFRQIGAALATHESGGITALDIEMAKRMDELAGGTEEQGPDRGA